MIAKLFSKYLGFSAAYFIIIFQRTITHFFSHCKCNLKRNFKTSKYFRLHFIFLIKHLTYYDLFHFMSIHILMSINIVVYTQNCFQKLSYYITHSYLLIKKLFSKVRILAKQMLFTQIFVILEIII